MSNHFYSIDTITPEMAERILKSSIERFNDISQKDVDYWAEKIKNHQWPTDAIMVFGPYLDLLEGARRISGIIQSGIPVRQTCLYVSERSESSYYMSATPILHDDYTLVSVGYSPLGKYAYAYPTQLEFINNLSTTIHHPNVRLNLSSFRDFLKQMF